MQRCARTAPFSGQHRAWPVAGECAGMPRVSYVVRRARDPSVAARLRCGAYQPVPAALGQYQCSKRRNLSVPPTGIHTKHMHHPASCIQRRVACNVPRKMQDARCKNDAYMCSIRVQHACDTSLAPCAYTHNAPPAWAPVNCTQRTTGSRRGRRGFRDGGAEAHAARAPSRVRVASMMQRATHSR